MPGRHVSLLRNSLTNGSFGRISRKKPKLHRISETKIQFFMIMTRTFHYLISKLLQLYAKSANDQLEFRLSNHIHWTESEKKTILPHDDKINIKYRMSWISHVLRRCTFAYWNRALRKYLSFLSFILFLYDVAMFRQCWMFLIALTLRNIRDIFEIFFSLTEKST